MHILKSYHLLMLLPGKGKKLFTLLFTCWVSFWGMSTLCGQGDSRFRAHQTRAVIVGISDYQNISDLEYAHRDAEALAAYLRSSAGGEVPDENIRLLLNEKATQMQLAMALDWLQEESQAGDRAYIYFSGHGDVEKKTARQRGFLLTYDAPNTTYMAGGAFPILFLQDIISELSAEKKVEVILMADACRAGKLAGNAIGGNHVTAEKLAESYANEIKILSCQKDELSQEGLQWGAGRGVFSYHLIEGLIGLADDSGDGQVSLRELRNYLESLVGQETAGNQLPMVVGDLSHSVAKVDGESLAKLRNEKEENLMKDAVVMKTRGPTQPDPDTLIWQQYLAFQEAIKEKHLLYPKVGAAYSLYQKIHQETILQAYRDEMKRDLAIALHDEAQQAINDYLMASPQELQQRWSYDEQYEQYPEYLKVAADLLGPNHFMHEDLRVKQLYFEGLELRLQGEKQKEKLLFEEALAKQVIVVEMDSSAAYAYNEIGLLMRRLKRQDEATEFFNQANLYSPEWVLPMANQVGNYIDLKKFTVAEEIAKKAIGLDSTFALTYYNLGVAYEGTEEWDKAMEVYKKAIQFDPAYSDAYYNLGFVYFNKGELEQTENYFLQYANKSPNAGAAIWSDLGFIASLQEKAPTAKQYFEKAISLNPEYPDTYLNLGEFYLTQHQLQEARQAIEKYIVKQPNEMDGYYLLASILAREDNPGEAINQLELAISKGFDDWEMLNQDENFEKLRKKSAFKKLLKKIEK